MNSERYQPLIIGIAILLAVILAFFVMRGGKNRAGVDEYNLNKGYGVQGENASSKNKGASKNNTEKTSKNSYNDMTATRIVNFTPPKRFEKIYECLNEYKFDQSLEGVNAILNDPNATGEEKVMAEFTQAQIYFTSKNFNVARDLFEKFIEKNPSHPMIENARDSISFIDNYDKFKNNYKSFEEEIKKKRY